MAKRYTHNYYPQFLINSHGDEDFREFYTEQFQHEARAELEGLRAEDVGGVILYLDAQGQEAAYFDYENLVGSIYKKTRKRSFEI